MCETGPEREREREKRERERERVCVCVMHTRFCFLADSQMVFP